MTGKFATQREKKMGVDWSVIRMISSQEFVRMSLLWPLSLFSSYLRLFFFFFFPSRPLTFFFPSLFPNAPSRFPRRRFPPGLQSKLAPPPICVVTGATSGLGRAAARALAAEGYHVVLVGRSSQGLDEEDSHACVAAFEVDMASINSIIQFESRLKQWLSDTNLHPSVQLLINNAEILATSSRLTRDGYDQMMETNYISAFFLTNLLLPLLKNIPVPSRVVNVTSFTHRSVFDVKVDKKSLICMPTPGRYPCARIYEYSKLCLLLFSYELHRQLHAMESYPNISVNAVDPGVVETNIMRELPRCLAQAAFAVLRCLCLLQSPEDGIGSILDAALAPPDVSGKYFFGGKGRTIQSSPLSYNAKLAEDLWSASNILFQESVLMKGH